jgi:hypothetical protein
MAVPSHAVDAPNPEMCWCCVPGFTVTAPAAAVPAAFEDDALEEEVEVEAELDDEVDALALLDDPCADDEEEVLVEDEGILLELETSDVETAPEPRPALEALEEFAEAVPPPPGAPLDARPALLPEAPAPSVDGAGTSLPFVPELPHATARGRRGQNGSGARRGREWVRGVRRGMALPTQ